MAISVIILGKDVLLTFASQKGAYQHYIDIKDRYDALSAYQGKDHLEVLALLDRHPRSKEKIGKGIKCFFSAPDEYGNNTCIHLERIDGTAENISIKKCLKGELSPLQRFKQGARKAVEPDINAAKSLAIKANLTKDNLVKVQDHSKPVPVHEVHIDHKGGYSFNVIVESFVELNNIDLASVEYDHKQTYGASFMDQALIDQFKAYHHRKARLGLSYSKKNLSKAYMARTKVSATDIILDPPPIKPDQSPDC